MGDLVKMEDLEAMSPVKYSAEDFALSVKAGDYLPRVQLMTSAAEPCKKGEFPINHYAMVSGQHMTDLGEYPDVVVLSWRPKALEIGEEVISVYDPKSPEFQRIQAQAEVKDSGCMFGPEFLLYIPSQTCFATLFMGSKSARRESHAVMARMAKAATLKSHLIETKKYSWYAPLVTPCSTPLDLPAIEKIQVEVEKFNNPAVQDVELAPEDGASVRER